MAVRTGQHVYVPENAVIAECVLILKVTAAAPFANIHARGVCARTYKFGYIKLRR